MQALHYINVHKGRIPPDAMLWKRLGEEAEECAREISPHSFYHWRRNLHEHHHYLVFCTACPLDEMYDRRAMHYKKIKRHWRRR